MINTLKKTNLFNILLIGFLLIIETLFLYYKDQDGNQIILTLFFIGLVLILKPQFIIYSIFFILPNQRLFVIPNTPFSLINILVLYLIISQLNKNFQENRKLMIMYFLILGYSLLNSFLNSDILVLLQVVKAISVFIAFVTFYRIQIVSKKNTFSTIILFFIVGVISASILNLFFDSGFTTESFSTKQRFSGGDFNNANIFGFDISFALSLIVVNIFNTKQNLFISFFSFLLLIVFGMLTQSRSFYLISTLILAVFVFKFFNLTNRKTAMPFLFTTALVIFTGLYFYEYIIEIFYAGFDRIINPKGGDISASRFTLWFIYNSFLLSNYQNLLFGIGISDITEKVGAFSVAHNAIIEVLTSWGAIGFLLFVILFIKSYKHIKNVVLKRKNKLSLNLISLLPLLVLFISSITGHSFVSNPFIIKFLTSIYILLQFNSYQTNINYHYCPIKIKK